MEAVTYAYDGEGNRLEKLSNGTMTKAYWYGAGTEILDEMTGDGTFSNEYVFFGGKRIAMRNVLSGVIYYYAEDMLGSSRAMVQAGQTSLCYDADFYPFGGERTITNTCSQNYKFEGKERDAETGNDDFGARYYESRIGRWLSADWSSVPVPVPYANLTNPQTLNLYAMVSDNPETFADLDGHCPNNEDTCSGQTQPNPVSSGKPVTNLESGKSDNPKTVNGHDQDKAQQQSDIYRLNGVVTLETSVTTTTTDSKGNKVTTVTTTQAFFSAKKGHEGAFLGAHQTTFTGNIFNRSQKSLSEAEATHVLGSKAIAAATEATAPGFGGELSRDIQAHPIRYLIDVGGPAAGPVLGVSSEADAIMTGIHALHSAYELEKEMHERGNQ